jgi:predicted aspartyl protease
LAGSRQGSHGARGSGGKTDAQQGVWLGLCALALGLLTAQGAIAQQCQLKLIASFDMQGSPAESIVVPITMNGKQIPTLIDTGATAGLMEASAATALGLTIRPVRQTMMIYSAGGRRYDRFATVPELEIGPLRIRNTDFIVADNIFHGDAGVTASLGQTALEPFDIEFDFAARKVRFFSQDHCEGKVVYWSGNFVSVPFKLIGGDEIALQMTLDGRDIDAVLDTGASFTYINSRVASQVYGIDETSPTIKRYETGNPAKPVVYGAPFESLSIGGINMPKPTILLIDDKVRQRARWDIPDKMQNQPGEFLPHFPHLLLGLDVLHHLRVYIAYREHKIYATAADAQ